MEIRSNGVSIKDLTDNYKNLGKETVAAVQRALSKDNNIDDTEIAVIEEAAKSDNVFTEGEKLLLTDLKSKNSKVIKSINIFDAVDAVRQRSGSVATERNKEVKSLSGSVELTEKFASMSKSEKQDLITGINLITKSPDGISAQKVMAKLSPEVKSAMSIMGISNLNDQKIKELSADKSFKKMPEFLQSFNTLSKNEQTVAVNLMKELNQSPPKADYRSDLRKMLTGVDKSRTNEVGKTLNKLNIYIPALNKNAPTAEDASTRMKTMYMGDYGPGGKAQADYVRDCLVTASKENFTVSLQIPNDYDKDLVIKNISEDLKKTEGLSDAEINSIVKNNLKLIGTENEGYVWAEDNKFMTEAGTVKTFPKIGDPIDKMQAFATGYLLPKTSANYAREGIHSAGLPENDKENMVEESSVQGAVNERDENQSAEMLGKALKKNVAYTRTYNEGGNMLPGTLPNGDAYAVVGRDGLLISTFKLEEDYAKDPKSVPEFANVAKKVTEMDKKGVFTKELIDETVGRLKAANDMPKGANPQAKAKEFLAKMEIVEKEVFPKDIGVDSKNIIFVPQPDFHVDMHMRPLAPGTVLINDFDENIKLLKTAKANSKKGSWEETELQSMIDNSTKMKAVMGPVMADIEKKLSANGIKVVKSPGVMQGDKKMVNFMNAVPGTSLGTNKQYYMTNYTSIKPLRDAFEAHMKDTNSIDKVYWIGNSGGGEKTMSGSESSLTSMGGMDCRENHEGY